MLRSDWAGEKIFKTGSYGPKNWKGRTRGRDSTRILHLFPKGREHPWACLFLEWQVIRMQEALSGEAPVRQFLTELFLTSLFFRSGRVGEPHLIDRMCSKKLRKNIYRISFAIEQGHTKCR